MRALFGVSCPMLALAWATACDEAPSRRAVKTQVLPASEYICIDDGECPDNHRCVGTVRVSGISRPGTCEPIPTYPALADGVVGRACGNDADCGAGHCATHTPIGASYPAGYCSARCQNDPTCGAGGVCLAMRGSITAGHCLQRCDPTAGCLRDGYVCRELGDGYRVFHACLPGSPPVPDYSVGGPCTTDAECPAHAMCETRLPLQVFGRTEDEPAPGGYCSHLCTFDADCGAGAQCFTRVVIGGICLALCSDSVPCREGYTCSVNPRAPETEPGVCIPEPPAP